METNDVDQAANTDAAKVLDFVLAKVGGKFMRFASVEAVPSGSETFTGAAVAALPDEKIGELYGAVAGVASKKFKDRAVALSSLEYQIKKMPVFDPSMPISVPIPAGTKAKRGPRAATGGHGALPNPAAAGEVDRFARKPGETFELLCPPDAGKIIGKLAPQAQALFSILVELAKSKGRQTISGAEINERMSQPDVVGLLNTRQPPLRIAQYYKGRLIGSGLIRTS